MKLATKLLFSGLLAGGSLLAQTVDNLPVSPKTPLFEPYAVAVDRIDNAVYISDSVQDRVVKFSRSLAGVEKTEILTLVANPAGLAVTTRPGLGRGLVVADASPEENRIIFVPFSGAPQVVLAGGGDPLAPPSDNVRGVDAIIGYPQGVAATEDGTVYVADFYGGLRVIANNADASVTTLASSTVISPVAVALDGSGNIWVSDLNDGVIKRVSTTTGVLNGSMSGFDRARGLLWIGGDTGLLVADTGNHTINGGTFELGVDGSPGSTPGGIGTAQFHEPTGLALDMNGTILVADLKNNLIRRINRDAAPLSVMTPAGGNFTNRVAIAVTNVLDGVTFRFTVNGVPPNLNSDILPANYSLAGGPTPLQVRAFHPDFLGSEVVSNTFNFAVAPLVMLPAGGSYSNAVPVRISTPTELTAIRFTETEAVPTIDDELWENGELNGTTILQAKGFRDGFSSSLVVSNNFSFFVNPLSISVPGGEFNNDSDIQVATLTDDAVIRYTINGGEPTEASPVWTDRAVVNGTLRLKAFKENYTATRTITNIFKFTVSDPVLSPATATTNTPVEVTITSETEDALIYWTIGDQPPTQVEANLVPANGKITVSRDGTLRVLAVKEGYTSSKVISGVFTLIADAPKITSAKTTSDNNIEVTLTTATPGARIHYLTGPGESAPTAASPSVASGETISLGTTGNLRAIAILSGFKNSPVTSTAFSFKVATPKVTPAGASRNNSLTVRLETATQDADLVYTLNDTAPTASNGTRIDGSTHEFTLAQDSTLRVIALKDGYATSDEASAVFQLEVDTPEITTTPALIDGSVTNINSVRVVLANETDDDAIWYRTDGTSPLNADGTVKTGSTQYAGEVTLTTNSDLRAAAVRSGFEPSSVASARVRIQVDTPVMTPPGGFFQEGTQLTLSVTRPDAVIYYTLDGNDPTEATGKRYTGPIQLSRLNFPATDLAMVRARAFAPNTLPSEIVSGTLAEQNTIGLSKGITAGSGATAIIPVVLSLKPGVELSTLQYRIQVIPPIAAGNLSSSAFQAISTSTNDFVPVIGSETSPVKFYAQQRQVPGENGVLINELVINFKTDDANLLVRDYSTINLLRLTTPLNSAGREYTVRVLHPSGTADGAQEIVELTAAPDQKITVANIRYLVGDTAPGRWYNVGDFGDGQLDNADVNNALNASLNIASPFAFSDAFQAMDVVPLDQGGRLGGDQAIRVLDWQVILDRSLRIRNDNFERTWSAAGLVTIPTVLRQSAQPFTESPTVPRPDWEAHALIEGGIIERVEPGATVSVPVKITVQPGNIVQILAFKVAVESEHGLGSLPTSVTFVPAAGIPDGFGSTRVSPNQVVYAWDKQTDLNLTGTTALGSIRFTVPADAQTGTCYKIRFEKADGAYYEGDDMAQYDLETLQGCVWVRAPKQERPFGRLSDEWRQRFFGRLDNVLANLNEDPDGDGKTNLEEYLEGSNPTQLRFHKLFNEWREARQKGFPLRWFSRPGTTYVVETATDADGPWTEIARINGDGSIKQVLDTLNPDASKLYRVRELETP